MARPSRNASPENILRPARTFFVTTKTSMGKCLLQSDRNANLLIDVLRSLVAVRAFELHDFVIMPDHVHVLLTVGDGMTVEKAMQLIKGRFSFRLKRELNVIGEVWQRGFSEMQVMSKQSFQNHREYIACNPVKAGLVDSADKFPFCFAYLAKKKMGDKPANAEAPESRQGAKARTSLRHVYGTTEVVPCYKTVRTELVVFGTAEAVSQQAFRQNWFVSGTMEIVSSQTFEQNGDSRHD